MHKKSRCTAFFVTCIIRSVSLINHRMRSTYTKISVLAALTLALSVGVPVSAQTTEAEIDASVSANSSTGVTVPPAKPLLREGDKRPPQDRRENIQQNRDLRNKMVEERKDIINARKEDAKEVRMDTRADLRDMRQDRREDMRNATNTPARKIIIEKFKDAKGELLKKARKDEVTIRQNAIVQELQLRIKSLKSIAARAEDVIKKQEEQGQSTSEIRLKLDTTMKKISAAEVAVETFATWKPTETGTSSSTEVSLEKPRQAAAGAITAIKDAGEALREVISSIFPRIEKPRLNATTTVETKNSVQTNN